jgi:hypothetical protein
MRINDISLTATMPHAINHRELEAIEIKNGRVEIGDILMNILSAAQGSGESTPAPATTFPQDRLSSWTTKSFAVNDVGVTLQKIAPGLPPMSVLLQIESKDLPLQPEGLIENIEPQRIELNSLTIPAPYGTVRPVARLDTIFIHFNLDGLLKQTIDKVEILNPTIYVGEPLFWYVDYYRQYAAGTLHTSPNRPQMAALASAEDDSETLASATIAATQNAATPKKNWSVRELQVHSGKLVLAPKGVPLPGFRQPFPFSFTTQLESGEFDATFDIPPDTYPLPDLKLELIGMRGQVNFNLPIKSVDNNLTETFWVDQIRWKQLHMENAHLSVTYDLNGIYGKFGGEGYEGYVEGGFDVYLNETYNWDGWISASNILTTEVTEKLFPAYFLLDGKVNASLVALGDSHELYEADIKFNNATPGKFSIAALNDMLNDLPPSHQAPLTDQITRIGLETLRDFEYDTVDAKGRFYGREGRGKLEIIGPFGSRNFEINVFDHRWKVDPPSNLPPSQTSEATPPSPDEPASLQNSIPNKSLPPPTPDAS